MQAAVASLVADGYTVTQGPLDYSSSSADVHVSGETPAAAPQSLQHRIDGDRTALAMQGINVDPTLTVGRQLNVQGKKASLQMKTGFLSAQAMPSVPAYLKSAERTPMMMRSPGTDFRR